MTVLVSAPGGVVGPPTDDAASPQVIDSFRLEGGRVVRLDLHERRFAAAVTRHGGPATGAFLAAARAALPREGDWFPRLELAGEVLRLRLRPCPPLGERVTLAPVTGVARRDPRTKGADLAAHEAARSAARHRGADEALLLDDEGRVLEGSTTTLLWWRDGRPCTSDAEVLDGVTLRVVESFLGLVERVPARLDDLAGTRVWALNALHGVRGVDAVLGGPPLAPPDADAVHAAWAALARPVAGDELASGRPVALTRCRPACAPGRDGAGRGRMGP